ncbi:MAG TPA: MiaB/RimO family radical SAM methylthiotransferase [Vicinamibacterales bacterium]|nr:MiaB/RimO family radical SAM methylthiotransferase [Vicinamibacterales bacterium]
MNFCVVTFGCRANQADSFRLEEEMCALGHVPVARESADLVVVNTCAVTAAAERSARQLLARIAREQPAARIAVTGCYATRQPDRLERLPRVVALVPNPRKAGLASAIGPAAPAEAGPAVLVPGAGGRTIYPLQVQAGCDERCSYCVVPFTRGPSTSRPLEAVVADARRLAAAGYQEAILTGVHLGAWGRDLAPRRSLGELLAALDVLPGDLRFRLSSLEPMDCTPEVIRQVARRGSRLAPHLHLPLQHASDAVLKAMRRPYTFDDFRRLLEVVRTALPDAAIGTDVIAGFPGESEADVKRLEQALDELPLSYAHVFAYSDRPGTEASRRRPKVSPREIRERAARLRERADGLRRRFEARQAGTERPALTLGDGTVALTDNYLKVRIPPGLPRNVRVRVRVVGHTPLGGEVVT